MIKNLLLWAIIFCMPQIIFAQWTTDTLQNTIIRDSSDIEETANLLATAPDGSTYTSWFESNPLGGYVLRMQYVNARGQLMWGSRGLLVSDKKQSSTLYRYDLKTDKDGNAIIGFQDIRSANASSQIVLYKIDKNGTFLWGNDGIVLTDTTAFSGSTGLSPTIGFTSANNIIVAWNQSPVGKPAYIAFQKLSPTGTLMWTDNRRLQDTLVAKFDRPTPIASTGTDDFIMHFIRRTGTGLGVSTMYAQRFDADGQKMWPAHKIVATRTIAFAFFPTVLPDGKGGIYVGFNSGNPSFASRNDVYMQRIRADSTAWNTTGVQLATQSTIIKSFTGMQTLLNRNEIWAQIQTLDLTQTNSGISIQKLDTAGNRLLSDTALIVFPISDSLVRYKLPYDIRATNDGLIGTYEENGTFNKEKLNAYKVDFNGNLVWRKAVCALESGKGRVTMSNFTQNQVVINWQDMRLSSTGGIYAQNVNNLGVVGARTNVQDLSAIRQMRLFPNPSNQTNLEFDLKKNTLLTISVFDLTGKLHYTKSQYFIEGTHQYPLSINSLTAGVYFVRLSDETGVKTMQWVKL